MKGGEFLDQLGDYKLLKADSGTQTYMYIVSEPVKDIHTVQKDLTFGSITVT